MKYIVFLFLKKMQVQAVLQIHLQTSLSCNCFETTTEEWNNIWNCEAQLDPSLSKIWYRPPKWTGFWCVADRREVIPEVCYLVQSQHPQQQPASLSCQSILPTGWFNCQDLLPRSSALGVSKFWSDTWKYCGKWGKKNYQQIWRAWFDNYRWLP